MSEAVKGAYSSDQVNIGWYGYEVTKTTRIRIGPSWQFPERVTVMAGKRMGRQSVRNPSGKDNPPLRPVARDSTGKAWAWCYDPESKEQGWVPVNMIKERASKTPWAHGPNGCDFHVGLEPSRKHEKSSTQGQRRNRVRVIAAKDVLVRYSPNGSGIFYLQRGDGVRELFRRIQNDFVAISVTSSKTTPPETRGWVDVRSLAGEKTDGIDISAADGMVDFKAVRGSGEDFIIAKATEGTSQIDKNFFQNIKEARKALLHVGAYHALKPQPSVSGTYEAEDFIRALRLAKLRSTDIRPTVRVEASKLDRDETQRYVGEFVGSLRLAGYDCMLSTHPRFMEWTKAFNTDLWILNTARTPKLPDPWDDYVLWGYGIHGGLHRNKCPDLSRIIQR